MHLCSHVNVIPDENVPAGIQTFWGVLLAGVIIGVPVWLELPSSVVQVSKDLVGRAVRSGWEEFSGYGQVFIKDRFCKAGIEIFLGGHVQTE